MEKRLYVQGFNQFITQPLEDKALRLALKQQGIEARRLSRFTQLALLGALPLKSKVQSDTAIYLASSFSSPSKFNKMFQQLNQQHIPSPLDFMANLNNAATFQLAKSLGVQNSAVFLTVNEHNYWQPLQLSSLDFDSLTYQTALVGWAFEHYRENQLEGSCWLLLSMRPEQAIGIIDLQSISVDPIEFLQPLHNLIKVV